MVFRDRLKKYIPVKVKRKVQLLFISERNNKWGNVVSKNQMNIFVFLSGFYQNLGDMAITYAQSKFLKDVYPDANIVMIPSTETYTAVKGIKKKIREKDLITITGGGNMDDIYSSLDDARLYVVKSFPQNKIVCFPQTMSYSNTKYGLKRKKKSRKVYNTHSDITLFAREKESLERMRQTYTKTAIECCPDIVLYLNKMLPKMDRKYITCCFRNDSEKEITSGLKSEIFEYVTEKFSDVRFVDTVDVDINDCMPDRFVDTLEMFWRSIKESKLVITDRLHCMIFCVITGTPCVAVDNSNHKIRGVYETWLKDITYIKLVYENSFEEIVYNIKSLRKIDNVGEISSFRVNFVSLWNACRIDT